MACAAGRDSDVFDDQTHPSGDGFQPDSGTTGGGDSGGFNVDGGTSGGGNNTDCSSATSFVYVVDSNNTLYKFDPQISSVSAFTKVGVVDCGGGLQPNSMAVARDGTAYVNMMNGGTCAGVYKVDINNAQCKGSTPFTCGAEGFNQFGMGYSTDSSTTTAESLFIGDTGSLGSTAGARLARLDPATGKVTVTGTLPASGPEFTGNAAGELWAFLPQAKPPKMMQVDKSSGNELKSFDLNALKSSIVFLPQAWAFAFWGGDYYIFLQGDTETSTSVWKVTASGDASKYIPNTGMKIVGAGVSTCAPVRPH